jgi:hypothetical protein
MSTKKSKDIRTPEKRKRTKVKPRNLTEFTTQYVNAVREKQALKRKQQEEEAKKAALERSTSDAVNRSLLDGNDADHNTLLLLNKVRELVDPVIRGTEKPIGDYKKWVIDLAHAFNKLDCSTNLMYAWEHARATDVCPHIQQLRIARNKLRKNLDVAKEAEQYFSELPEWLLK